jgi:hypothetical protein
MARSPAAARTLYRALLRAAVRLSTEDGIALRAEARARFRAGAGADEATADDLVDEGGRQSYKHRSKRDSFPVGVVSRNSAG